MKNRNVSLYIFICAFVFISVVFTQYDGQLLKVEDREVANNINRPPITSKSPDHRKILISENQAGLVISEVNHDVKGPLDLSIRIGDQDLKLKLKPLQLNQFNLPQGDGLFLYDKLSEKAQADPVAARLLSELLARCSRTHLSQDSHDEAIKRLVQNREYPASNLKRPYKVSSESVELIREEFETDYEQCKSLNEDKRKESTDWAKLAAEGGDYLGLDMLARDPNVSTVERVSIYEKKWSDFGDVYSAASLSSILSGIGSLDQNPLFKDLQPDPKKAYAYFLASSSIEVAMSQRFNPGEADQISYEHSVFEQLLTSKLTLQEHSEAEQLARELIESNPNCCAVDTSATHEVSLDD